MPKPMPETPTVDPWSTAAAVAPDAVSFKRSGRPPREVVVKVAGLITAATADGHLVTVACPPEDQERMRREARAAAELADFPAGTFRTVYDPATSTLTFGKKELFPS